MSLLTKLEEENVALRAEVERLREMWESERTAVKNVTEMYGEITGKLKSADLQVGEMREKYERLQEFAEIAWTSSTLLAVHQAFEAWRDGEVKRNAVIKKQGKPIREGDGHICIAAEEVPCSLCGRVTEKQLGTSPTERPCCVEAYARGHAVGIAQRGPSCSPSCGCNCHEEG